MKQSVERALEEMEKFAKAWEELADEVSANRAFGMRIAKRLLEYEMKKEVDENEK